ncbi:right-handed parallel beta-helix repeat-containing protein [Rhizobium paknamense]|uniref:Parallel beta-helix repeat protein n=1 Tax=Rhizobium paknamense TaxID=1206817 RepID=A0ABU0IAV2_9HYPH|nr:right-handed parallel beta-helix repeat-containing protein [Rhizobium paknamense]MDQ0455359.1 parallel beta-helix repeat protein [Rhizobium paknamense]
MHALPPAAFPHPAEPGNTGASLRFSSQRLYAAGLPIGVILAFVGGFALSSAHAAPTRPGAVKTCGPEVYEALREAPDDPADSVTLDCVANLTAEDVVMKDIVLEGARASGAGLDCHGGIIGIPGHLPKGAPPTISIRSLPEEDGGWSVPRDIHIRNCKVYGTIQIMGMGPNGEAEEVRQSSLSQGHTQRAQAAAPSHILLENLTIVADGPIPLYIAPGVTHVEINHSTLTGHTKGTAIYLDAESGHNSIIANRFELGTRNREMIAVDGSAHNVITGNTFIDAGNGGIFLYRNCGEGGTIRHQTPQHNQISDNHFLYRDAVKPRPAVWLGSKEIWRALYCYQDPSLPFGSGADNRSFADFNTVTGNEITGADQDMIRDSGASNTVSDNRMKP